MTKRIYAALVALSLFGISGCLTSESKLNADGSGTMTLSYVTKPAAMVGERRRLEGPHVQVVKDEHKDGRALFELSFDDARQLNTSRYFENVEVTMADNAGNTDLTVKIVHKTTQRLTDEIADKVGKEVKIAITLPGEVVTSNATSTQGSTVTWTFASPDFTNMREVLLTATYKGSAPAPAKSPAAS